MKILPVYNNQYNGGFKANQTSKQSNNVNFKATLSEPLKETLLSELLPQKGHKVIARLERQLANVAPGLTTSDIIITSGKATLRVKEEDTFSHSTLMSFTQPVDTDDKITLLRDWMKPDENGTCELDKFSGCTEMGPL